MKTSILMPNGLKLTNVIDTNCIFVINEKILIPSKCGINKGINFNSFIGQLIHSSTHIKKKNNRRFSKYQKKPPKTPHRKSLFPWPPSIQIFVTHYIFQTEIVHKLPSLVSLVGPSRHKETSLAALCTYKTKNK